MRDIFTASLIMLIIGGLNWGVVGAFNMDLVAAVFGPMSILCRLTYLLFGAAAVYVVMYRLNKRHARFMR